MLFSTSSRTEQPLYGKKPWWSSKTCVHGSCPTQQSHCTVPLMEGKRSLRKCLTTFCWKNLLPTEGYAEDEKSFPVGFSSSEIGSAGDVGRCWPLDHSLVTATAGWHFNTVAAYWLGFSAPHEISGFQWKEYTAPLWRHYGVCEMWLLQLWSQIGHLWQNHASPFLTFLFPQVGIRGIRN